MIRTKCRLRPNQSHLTSLEYEIDICSDKCVFAQLPEGFQVVRHGHKEDWPAIAGNNSIWINVSNKVHPPGHPLHMSEISTIQEERTALLSRINKAKPRHIVRVHDVCNCGIILDRIEGWPLADINTWPLWLRSGNEHRADVLLSGLCWSEFVRILADLAEGLQELHNLGIAHGDPFPINALVAEKHGIWVDINGVVNATPLSIAVDIWAFLVYTVITRTLKLKTWNPDVLRQLLAVAAESEPKNVLSEIASLLAQSAGALAARETPVDETSVAAIAEMFSLHSLQLRVDELGHVARALAVTGLTHFYMAYEWNACLASERERYLAAEQARHTLVEQELQRTLKSRYQAHIDSLTSWNAELNRGNTWLQEQRDRWQKVSEERDQLIAELRNWINRLEEGKKWLEEQLANWQRVANEREQLVQKQHNWITQLEQNTTWLEEELHNWQRIAKERKQTGE